MLPKHYHFRSMGALILLLSGFLLVSNPPKASATTPDPVLDELIRTALENHPDLDAMRRMVEASESRHAMSRSYMNPELTVGVMGLPDNFKYNIDPATALQIGVMQRLPWKGKLKSAEASALARTEVAKVDYESARQNMAAMVAMAYYDLAALEEEKVLLQEGLRLTEEMTSAATWMTGSAMGRLSDIDKSRLEEENWKLKIVANIGAIKRQQAALAYAVGTELDSVLFHQAHMPEGLPSLPLLDSLLAPDSFENAPVIREALASEKASRKEVERARLGWYPDFDVMLTYDIKPDLKSMGGVAADGMAIPASTTNQMNMISLGVTFPLPLWSNGNQRAEIAEMTSMRHSASARVADARLKLESEIRQLHASWEEQNNCCAFVQETLIGRAEALYRTALIDYQSGKTPFMELSQARMNLVMAKMELSMSRGMAWGIKAKLFAALGTLASELAERENNEK